MAFYYLSHWLLLLFCWISLISAQMTSFERRMIKPKHTCYPIPENHVCSQMQYKSFLLPNVLGDKSLENAIKHMAQYSSLLDAHSSDQMLMFLCSYFFPLCSKVPKLLPPCRHLCDSSKQACQSYLRKHNLQWPEELECTRFSANETLCFGNATQNEDLYKSAHLFLSREPSTLVHSHSSGPVCLLSTLDKPSECRTACEDYPLNIDDALPIRLFNVLLYTLVIACSTMLLFIHYQNPMNLTYPFRPVKYICFNYLMLCVLQLIFFMHGNVACESEPQASLLVTCTSPLKLTLAANEKSFSCFIIAQFSHSMILSTWGCWFIMHVAYYLESVCKWSEEAIRQKDTLFFLFACILPHLLSLFAVFNGKVEGSPLSNVCTVDSHMKFITFIVPIGFLLLSGLLLFFCSLRASYKINKHFKASGIVLDKFERLITQITILSLLFTLPGLGQLLLHHYEDVNSSSWQLYWARTRCDHSGHKCTDFPDAFPAPIWFYWLKQGTLYFPAIGMSLFIAFGKVKDSMTHTFQHQYANTRPASAVSTSFHY